MIVVRFREYTMYDIQHDCDVMTLMATTDKGSYFANVQDEGHMSRREAVKRFKEKTVELIQQGVDPCEVELNG